MGDKLSFIASCASADAPERGRRNTEDKSLSHPWSRAAPRGRATGRIRGASARSAARVRDIAWRRLQHLVAPPSYPDRLDRGRFVVLDTSGHVVAAKATGVPAGSTQPIPLGWTTLPLFKGNVSLGNIQRRARCRPKRGAVPRLAPARRRGNVEHRAGMPRLGDVPQSIRRLCWARSTKHDLATN